MGDIVPPPDLLFGTYEEALDALKAHGMQHSYGFVLKRSKPHNSETKVRYYYQCDRFRNKFQSTAKVLSTSTRQSQPVLYQCNDMFAASNFLVETGQVGDPVDLVEARNMALATEGLFASCTPTMAWNYHFGDMEAFYAERFAQIEAQNAVVEPQDAVGEPQTALPEHEDTPVLRPKRAAAMAAPDAWRGLSSRKRRRRQ